MTTSSSRSEQRTPDGDWLLRLRWGALFGQAVLLTYVAHGLGLRLPLGPLWSVVGLGFLVQVGIQIWLGRGGRLTQGSIFAILAFDSLLLSALLALGGGPHNPFSIFLLVNLALAAVLLRGTQCWGLVVFNLALFGGLFLIPEGAVAGLQLPDHASLMTLHLRGMWFAVAAAAFFIVYFVQRINRALQAQAADLTEARREQARTERVRGLATLAAGTAHELSTPLSTIAVASAELERSLSGVDPTSLPDGSLDDVQLIRDQVRRCREVLQQLSVEAGHPLGEQLATLELTEVVSGALASLPGADRVRWDPSASPSVRVIAPRRALVRTVRSLLKNALQASPPAHTVSAAIEVSAGMGVVVVTDTGEGMDDEHQSRAFEPFFSTREPGEGMGLGLYLGRGLAEQLGGELTLRSHPGEGTVVTLRLPRHAMDADAQTAAGSGGIRAA
jgi:two-component system sensor histidine kinase RegB